MFKIFGFKFFFKDLSDIVFFIFLVGLLMIFKRYYLGNFLFLCVMFFIVGWVCIVVMFIDEFVDEDGWRERSMVFNDGLGMVMKDVLLIEESCLFDFGMMVGVGIVRRMK